MNADLLLRCSDYGEGIKNECSNAINSASYAHIESCGCSERSKPLASQPAIVFAGFFVRFSLSGRRVSFRFQVPAGFYKSEESAVQRRQSGLSL